MTEYTVHIDSHHGLATNKGLTAVHETLVASRVALGAVTGIDGNDAYGATFQINADTIGAAVVAAETEFGVALERAGHPATAIAHIEVARDPSSIAA